MDEQEAMMMTMQMLVQACQTDDVSTIKGLAEAGVPLPDIRLVGNTSLLHLAALAGSRGYEEIHLCGSMFHFPYL